MLLAEKLKLLREEAKQPQRRVAAALDIDTATYCKIENGKYVPSKEQVIQLADFFKYDSNEMTKFWLVDKFISIAQNEDMANEALLIAQNMLNTAIRK